METKSGSTPESSQGLEVLTIRSFRDRATHVVARTAEFAAAGAEPRSRTSDRARRASRSAASRRRAEQAALAVALRELRTGRGTRGTRAS